MLIGRISAVDCGASRQVSEGSDGRRTVTDDDRCGVLAGGRGTGSVAIEQEGFLRHIVTSWWTGYPEDATLHPTRTRPPSRPGSVGAGEVITAASIGRVGDAQRS